MLRKGIVVLMMTVMSIGSVQATDGDRSGKLMGFLRGPAMGRPGHQVRRSTDVPGVTHAVIADADRQVPEIRQTSDTTDRGQLQPAATSPHPMPVQYAPTGSSMAYADAPRHFSAGPVDVSVPSQGNVNWQPQSQPFHFASSPSEIGGNYYGGGNAVSSGAVMTASPGSLYPAPIPGIPHQLGGTQIVHPAFHPHEMLYPHEYKSMYGPFYYQVKGGWIVTPFGVWSKENWKLKGTTVDVKYKSHISPFAGFHRPVIR